MNIATVFSGIGAPEKASYNVFGRKNVNIVFACDNGEIELKISENEIRQRFIGMDDNQIQNEIKNIYKSTGKTNWMKISYFANHTISEDNWHEDIRFINGKNYLNKIDLLVGGSPCQSFSAMGHRGGLEDARGTLFYNYAKLIQDSQPRFFIYENVTGMLTHDGGQTWNKILEIFHELNYSVSPMVLNSAEYGIPQNRKRIYVVGIRGENSPQFVFPEPQRLLHFAPYYYDEIIPAKYYFKETGFRFVMTHPNRAKINGEIIRTEKANQQFNWNGDFVFENYDERRHSQALRQGAYLGEYNHQQGLLRKLTPNECLKLMGFNQFNIKIDDHHMYRQAGNSMTVTSMEAIIRELRENYGL